jgi:hypothetical protein
MDPSEVFPSPRLSRALNEGGQRGTDYLNLGARRSADIWRMNLTAGAQYETGSVTSFESAELHDYVACDATRAYSSARFTAAPNSPKVREVTRQLVYVRPDVLLVFDRIEATDPRFERRFHLHALSRPVLSSDGTTSVQRGGGRLVVRTLVPATARRAVIDGFQVGAETLAALSESDEGAGARLEVSDSTPQRRAYFLHYLHIADGSSPPPPAATVIDDETRVGARLVDGETGRETTVTFAKEGDLGGQIQVVTSQGMTVYAGRLGAGGVVFPPVADGGTPMGEDAGLPSDGGVTPPSQPGCGCRATPAPRAPWALGSARSASQVRPKRARRRSHEALARSGSKGTRAPSASTAPRGWSSTAA